jgi:ketosteroid isomerase-like protein
MSQENVETFERGLAAYNRRDVEGVLDTVHTEVEWHPLLPVLLGGEATVYRGHDGVRELMRELDESFPDLHSELSDVRRLGERVPAIGRLRGRGKERGVVTETEIVWVADLKDGKGIRVREYLDPDEALEAVALRE